MRLNPISCKFLGNQFIIIQNHFRLPVHIRFEHYLLYFAVFCCFEHYLPVHYLFFLSFIFLGLIFSIHFFVYFLNMSFYLMF